MRSYSNFGDEKHSRLTLKRLESDGPMMDSEKKADKRFVAIAGFLNNNLVEKVQKCPSRRSIPSQGTFGTPVSVDFVTMLRKRQDWRYIYKASLRKDQRIRGSEDQRIREPDNMASAQMAEETRHGLDALYYIYNI